MTELAQELRAQRAQLRTIANLLRMVVALGALAIVLWGWQQRPRRDQRPEAASQAQR